MLENLRVLVVEDEAVVAMMMEDFLDEMGCKVVAVAARLDDAIQKATELDIDFAMLDVNLAGQLSYPVAEILRQRDVPFIFATGYGAQGLPAALQDSPVLAKPFRHAQLAALVGEVSGRHQKP